jgi:hypothetical protein
MNDALCSLMERLESANLRNARALPWGAPIPVFGNVEVAEIATLGLNPSNLEFMDEYGKELEGARRRFHTLGSLGIDSWRDAGPAEISKIYSTCIHYFDSNPYDAWFKQLDYLLGDSEFSYYKVARHACHLDLVPFATACKWSDLNQSQRRSLVQASAECLARVIENSRIRVLVLNGASVVSMFERAAGVVLKKEQKPEWSLPRRTGPGVMGYAYVGEIDAYAGFPVGRTIRVLGFNHNIQSSYGVTQAVKHLIRAWLGDHLRGAE